MGRVANWPTSEPVGGRACLLSWRSRAHRDPGLESRAVELRQLVLRMPIRSFPVGSAVATAADEQIDDW